MSMGEDICFGNISGNWNRITIDLHNRFANALPSTPLIQYADPSLPVYFGQQEVFDKICEMGVKLRSMGVTHVMIACNTFHIRRQEFMERSGLFMFDMITAVKQLVIYMNLDKVAIISTAETVAGGLYESEKYELLTPLSEEQEIITKLIIDNSKMLGEPYCEELVTIVNSLVSRGAQAVIIGCTDLTSLIPKTVKNIVFFLDPMSELVRLAVNANNL